MHLAAHVKCMSSAFSVPPWREASVLTKTFFRCEPTCVLGAIVRRHLRPRAPCDGASQV